MANDPQSSFRAAGAGDHDSSKRGNGEKPQEKVGGSGNRLDATTPAGAAADAPLGDGGSGSAGPSVAAKDLPSNSIDKTAAMGNALWLMTQSPLHRNLLISEVELLLMPAIAYGQFRLWRRPDNIPIGFASWALVSSQVEARITLGRANKLRHQEWKSGDRAWIMDFIFPFGGQDAAMKELQTVVFPGRKLNTFGDTAFARPPEE